ncbi:MAG: 30S ribosome-binding factor RbfA [Atopostipes suicloacalis]|nr:30S ribosome-binding factor RbfA [Atopostipes suicloacalis]
MAKYRVGRVAELILREVNDILLNDIRDPRVEGITITDVDVTGDLQEATIYYSTLETDDETKKVTQIGLDKATGLIRKELGARMTTYHTPEIAFERDESVERGNRIDELLNQIKNDEK